MQGLDTAYIGLPEHSWRLAFTSSMIGIQSTLISRGGHIGSYLLSDMYVRQRTTPSVSLGFNAGYRSFGFGYSWDAMHAYSRNLNFSLGSKSIGIEFMRQISTNISGQVDDNQGGVLPFEWVERLSDRPIQNRITSTSLTVWYALNSSHYSHNAAIKQSYIQKKTAGSLLVQLNYASVEMSLDEFMAAVLSQVVGVETHQVGIGAGYGINYTPNKGKVLLHLSAMAQLICFSHNLITRQDSILLKIENNRDTTVLANALHRISSRYPVHVTGTMRAAVSWEINKWVHLNAWAQVNNMRFMAQAEDMDIKLSDWNWQVNLSIGVRLGGGEKRRRKVLEDSGAYVETKIPEHTVREVPTKPLPRWVTDYFYSSRP